MAGAAQRLKAADMGADERLRVAADAVDGGGRPLQMGGRALYDQGGGVAKNGAEERADRAIRSSTSTMPAVELGRLCSVSGDRLRRSSP
jgi:hypothetical protein